jgi:hypothetical protein
MHNSSGNGQSRRGTRPHGRWLVSGLMAIGLMFGAHWGLVDAGTGKPLAIPDLTGDWVSDKGEKIHIDFSNLTGSPLILSTFLSGTGNCPYGDTRSLFFQTYNFTDANTMHGQMWACTGTEVLVRKCHVDSKFEVDYTTTSISKSSIIGTYTSEWYAPQDGDQCKFTRDPSGDTQKPFQLIRQSANPCPDTAAVKQYSQVSNRAVGNIAFISRHLPSSAGQVAQGLASAQTQLNTISRGLGEIVAAGDDCDKLHSVIDEIEQFQSAIDQINNAGCNTMAMAGGFDNLFQAAGKLGNAFNPFPALSPAFTILAQDQGTFFTPVSGNLDPEIRWADQFQYVDGYIPNCQQ